MARKTPAALAGQAALPGLGGADVPIAQKVAYVKAARQTRQHDCHWPGCGRQVKPSQWGCYPHWMRLPPEIRSAIWLAYRPGQEESGRVTKEYFAAAQRAQKWIAEHGGPA